MNEFSKTDSRLESVASNVSADPSDDSIDLRFIVVGKKCKQNKELEESLKILQYHWVFSDTGFEYINDAEDDTIFILDNFEGDIFSRLNKAHCRIMGPPVIISAAKNGHRVPYNHRPLYCTVMYKQVLCFTGFRVKEELSRIVDLVHHMGGSIRKDFSTRVTHLVANCTEGSKYRLAVGKGTPIMTQEWVYRSWDQRDVPGIRATDDSLMENKMSPFFFTVISFMGFTKEESKDMEQITVENGGTVVEEGSPSCTHLVVNELSISQVPHEAYSKHHVVKQEWFWASIQMEACAEEHMYRFEEPEGALPLSTPGIKNTATPKTLSGSKSRKRKRLKENLQLLASEGEIDTPMYKRRSSEITHMSINISYLDETKSPDISGNLLQEPRKETPPVPKEALTKRQQTIMELFQTEKNYVGILHTVVKLFKEEIERPDQPGGPLLDATDIKHIFGQIPPLYDIHMKIRDELSEIVADWPADFSIGDIFLRHVEAMARVYPPFVNFFENIKETIAKCDKTKPRFHAFLKVCQSKPECGRQTLSELIIRPVQRLPSVMLLLKDLLKRTEEGNPDRQKIEGSISAVEKVMLHINEDKRKTENHQAMFDVINDIENCPPNLLSSHRRFISKIDVLELTEELIGRGDHATIFVFSDSIQMCKRRVKVLNTKSPAGHSAKTPQKAYKHIEVMQLSCIKRIVNVVETADCRNVFALITKKMGEDEKLYAFAIVSEVNKEGFLTQLSKAICDSMCRADFPIETKAKETLLTTLEDYQLNIDTSDLGNRTLSKAASRFGKRVSRAFSFNKTPRKLKRAISSMTQVMSPMNRNSTTPKSNLAAMRLASVNDLTSLNLSLSRNNNLDESVYESPPDESSFMLPSVSEIDEMSVNSFGSSIEELPGRNSRRDTLAGDNLRMELKAPNKKTRRLSTVLSMDESPVCSEMNTPVNRKTPKTPRTIGHSWASKFL